MEGLNDANRAAGASGMSDAHKGNASSPKNPMGALGQQAHGYAASMEGASGVPAKIDEAIEPD